MHVYTDDVQVILMSITNVVTVVVNRSVPSHCLIVQNFDCIYMGKWIISGVYSYKLHV